MFMQHQVVAGAEVKQRTIVCPGILGGEDPDPAPPPLLLLLHIPHYPVNQSEISIS